MDHYPEKADGARKFQVEANITFEGENPQSKQATASD